MRKSFDLRQKKVIDADTAEMIGYIRNMDIDIETGRINSVSVPRFGLSGYMGRSRTVTVPWERVVAIGSEYVLVKQK